MILEKFPVSLRPPTVISNTVIHTEKELLNFINENNGKKDIFVNLYYYTKSSCCSSFFFFDDSLDKFICNRCKKPVERLDLLSFIIDSIVFDLDPMPPTNKNKIKQWIKAKRMVYYFKDYETYLVKSGKGFHFYIRTLPFTDKDFEFGAKNAIKNFQIQTEKIFGVTDWVTHGDTSQQIRVPGTYNVRSGLFCTTLDPDHLELKHRDLQKITEKQPPIRICPINLGKRLDLKKYDEKITEEDFIHEGELILNFNPDEKKNINLSKIFNVYHIDYNKLSICVKTMLNNEFLDYRQRFLLINIMKNFGLSELDCEKLIKCVLWSTPDPSNKNMKKQWNWSKHVIERDRQVYYIYHKSYGIPSCKTGINLGFKIIGLCNKCENNDIMKFR